MITVICETLIFLTDVISKKYLKCVMIIMILLIFEIFLQLIIFYDSEIIVFSYDFMAILESFSICDKMIYNLRLITVIIIILKVL